MKNKKSPVGFIIILLVVVTGAVLLVRHFHLNDFQIIRPDVLYTGGQPRGMDYTRLLYKYHISTIVNVRSASEHIERNWHNEEITWTRNNGVRYIEMSIDKKNYFPDQQILEKFLAIMADKTNRPVFLHGTAKDGRVAMLTAAWLIKTNEATVEETSKVAEKIEELPLTSQEVKFIKKLKD